MGARVHIPRTVIVALLATAAGGCIDFVEPDLPERGAPALVQAFLRAAGDSLAVEATLTPGLDDEGFRRTVLRETLLIADTAIEPTEVELDGKRNYAARWSVADVVSGNLRFEAPTIAEVGAPPPALRWSGIRPLDTDTVRLMTGEELALRIAIGRDDDPVPELRQWQLQLTGADGSFRIGADGVPPDTIIVPARWLPNPSEGVIAARLSYVRSGTVRPAPGDYIGLLLLDARVTWTIEITDGAAVTRRRFRDAHE